MGKSLNSFDLEEILYKYERLTSLIHIMRMLVAEVVDVAGVSENAIPNALFEVEMEMEKNNDMLNGAIQQKGGVLV